MKTRLLPWVALVVALAGTMGSLSLSWLLGLKACPLCFYQRAFAMGAAGVIGVGLASGMGKMKTLSLVALPVSVAGLCVALFHVSLELRGILECPEGLYCAKAKLGNLCGADRASGDRWLGESNPAGLVWRHCLRGHSGDMLLHQQSPSAAAAGKGLCHAPRYLSASFLDEVKQAICTGCGFG
jgi:disulfide bond formation protein DsbB